MEILYINRLALSYRNRITYVKVVICGKVITYVYVHILLDSKPTGRYFLGLTLKGLYQCVKLFGCKMLQMLYPVALYTVCSYSPVVPWRNKGTKRQCNIIRQRAGFIFATSFVKWLSRLVMSNINQSGPP